MSPFFPVLVSAGLSVSSLVYLVTRTVSYVPSTLRLLALVFHSFMSVLLVVFNEMGEGEQNWSHVE